MKLSVIIPIFNGKPFLENLIKSIEAFTITNFECIFIDNNSSDNSIKILRKLLAGKSFCYSIISEKKQGAGCARNAGIKIAKGKYLAFLDCDDIILPEKFEYDMKILENYDVDFVFCRAKRLYEDGRVIKHPIDGIVEGINQPPELGLIWLQNFFILQGPGSIVVKKSVVEQLNGFHSSLTGEDAYLFIKMGLIFKGYFYNRTYFHYFRHRNSTISKSNKIKTVFQRYFELRKNLFTDEIIIKNPVALHILKEQLQIDILKLQQLGHNIKSLHKDEKLKNLKLSFLLFNPISLFINRKVSHLKYNPFYQIDRRLIKKFRDKIFRKQ